MTAINKQALRSKARSASAGEWIKESGDGWEAICSSDGQANGNFIIAHFEGPDAKENREFVQVANPASVLKLLDELESAEKRIAELEARTITVKFEPIPMEELSNRGDGKKHPYMFWAGYNSAVVHCESVLHQACAAAGISVKGE